MGQRRTNKGQRSLLGNDLISDSSLCMKPISSASTEFGHTSGKQTLTTQNPLVLRLRIMHYKPYVFQNMCNCQSRYCSTTKYSQSFIFLARAAPQLSDLYRVLSSNSCWRTSSGANLAVLGARGLPFSATLHFLFCFGFFASFFFPFHNIFRPVFPS